jgi:uncharacterized protein (DUF433 family)
MRFFMQLTRITVDPNQMAGVPCIRGLRIPAATIVGMIADRMNHEEILRAYPDLEAEDIRKALALAAENGKLPSGKTDSGRNVQMRHR